MLPGAGKESYGTESARRREARRYHRQRWHPDRKTRGSSLDLDQEVNSSRQLCDSEQKRADLDIGPGFTSTILSPFWPRTEGKDSKDSVNCKPCES